MRRHRLAGPQGAGFRGVESQSVNTKSILGAPGGANSSQLLLRNILRLDNSCRLQLSDGKRMDDAVRMAPRAVRGEPRLSFVVQNSFRQDRSRTISGAQEKHIVVSGHCQ